MTELKVLMDAGAESSRMILRRGFAQRSASCLKGKDCKIRISITIHQTSLSFINGKAVTLITKIAEVDS
jgi:hypothetical protein